MNTRNTWLAVCAVALAVLLPGPPALAAEPTLATVKKRGELVCGVNGNLPAFSYLNDKKERLGLDADYCRAIAAAVLGDATKVRFVPLPIAVVRIWRLPADKRTSLLREIGPAAVAALLLVAPYGYAYALNRATLGERLDRDILLYSATLWNYLATTPANVVHGEWSSGDLHANRARTARLSTVRRDRR